MYVVFIKIEINLLDIIYLKFILKYVVWDFFSFSVVYCFLIFFVFIWEFDFCFGNKVVLFVWWYGLV